MNYADIIKSIRTELTEYKRTMEEENYPRAASIASHIHYLSEYLIQISYSKVTIGQDK